MFGAGEYVDSVLCDAEDTTKRGMLAGDGSSEIALLWWALGDMRGMGDMMIY